jgi:hypothetical protein
MSEPCGCAGDDGCSKTCWTRARALKAEAERDEARAELDRRFFRTQDEVNADRAAVALAATKAAESRSVVLEEALRGLAKRWGRVAEGGLTAHDAHTMLSEVRALASGTTGEGAR